MTKQKQQQLINGLTMIRLSARYAQDNPDAKAMSEALQGIEYAAEYLLRKLEEESVVK